jgi:hypothetical protein
MNFAEFVKWLGGTAALGAVSAFALQAIKALFPSVKDNMAKIASVVFAALASIVAQLALPVIPQLPAEIEQFWPVIVWLWSQIVWGIWLKPKPEL